MYRSNISFFKFSYKKCPDIKQNFLQEYSESKRILFKNTLILMEILFKYTCKEKVKRYLSPLRKLFTYNFIKTLQNFL